MNAPEVVFPHLGISIEKLDRIFVTLRLGDFSLPIYWYGFIITSAVVIAFIMALREAKRTGQKTEDYYDFMLIAPWVCLVGARLYFVIFSWDKYKDNPITIFALREGGLAIYGAVLAGIVTAYFFCRKKKMNFWLFADTAAPSLLFGQMAGRWGNFFNREVYGGYTDSLFAMRYLKNQAPDLTPDILAHTVTENGSEYIQVHPTFLYESAWSLAVIVIMIIYRRKKKKDGDILCIYLIGYGIGRFIIEGIRVDQLSFFGSGLAVSQLLSIVLVAVGAGLLVGFRYRKDKNENKDMNE